MDTLERNYDSKPVKGYRIEYTLAQAKQQHPQIRHRNRKPAQSNICRRAWGLTRGLKIDAMVKELRGRALKIAVFRTQENHILWNPKSSHLRNKQLICCGGSTIITDDNDTLIYATSRKHSSQLRAGVVSCLKTRRWTKNLQPAGLTPIFVNANEKFKYLTVLLS